MKNKWTSAQSSHSSNIRSKLVRSSYIPAIARPECYFIHVENLRVCFSKISFTNRDECPTIPEGRRRHPIGSPLENIPCTNQYSRARRAERSCVSPAPWCQIRVAVSDWTVTKPMTEIIVRDCWVYRLFRSDTFVAVFCSRFFEFIVISVINDLLT